MNRLHRRDLIEGGIDPHFFNMVSQFAHFWTMFGITSIMVKVGRHTHRLAFYIFLSLLLQLIYSIWHEFWYDPTHEDPATRGSDVEDFFFLVAGALVGLFVELVLP